MVIENQTGNQEIIEFFKKRMLTTKEAAYYLGLSVITIRRKASVGELTSYRPSGKNLYFEIRDLDEYVFSNKRSSIKRSAEVSASLNFKISKRWKL